MTHNKQEPVIDGDPFTGYQMVERVVEVSTIVAENSPTAAKVIAKLRVTAGGNAELEQVTFGLKRENNEWKINDITSGVRPSIRSYFRKSYGA